MTGRQALYVLYAEFAIDEERGALYDLSDLMLVKYKSDEHAPRFLNLWLHTVQGLSEKQPENNLMTLLKAQLEHSSALKDDISHFNRLSKGDPEGKYDYLIESLKLRQQDQEEDQQGEDPREALRRSTAPHGAGTPGRGRARRRRLHRLPEHRKVQVRGQVQVHALPGRRSEGKGESQA